jgi:hypothetical protein
MVGIGLTAGCAADSRRREHDPPGLRRRRGRPGHREHHLPSEKDAKLAQNLGQLQPFTAVLPQQECMGHFSFSGPP